MRRWSSVRAFSSGSTAEATVVERALNAYLLGRLLDSTQASAALTKRIAYAELHRSRRERGAASVIDPSVFISALIGSRGGAPDLVMRAFVDDRIKVVVSPLLLAELELVLRRPKFAA
jgi:hypothetical protein